MYVTDASVREQKKQLRSQFKQIRDGIALNEKKAADRKIASVLLNSDAYKNSRTILSYVSMGSEADTYAIIAQALKDGKQVAVPKCDDNDGKMTFYVISSLDMLEKGFFSVMEPKPDICSVLTDFGNSLCIVPGLAFDEYGYRIGYGKGYYDRFLSKHTEIFKIGIEYSFCIVSKLVSDAYDVAADMVITEKYTIMSKDREAKNG